MEEKVMDNLLAQMGSRILKKRKQLRMTQEELAERAGVMPQTISTAELGKKALRPENIVRIAAALDISTDYLLMGKINDISLSLLSNKISQLPPEKVCYLEDIIDSYIAAVIE